MSYNNQYTCAQCRFCVLCEDTPAEYKAAFCTVDEMDGHKITYPIEHDMHACTDFEPKEGKEDA